MSNPTQGIDIVIGAQAKQATAAFALLQGFVQGIGQSVAQFAGRAAHALAEMAGEALHTADEMGKAAQKAGTTTEKFSSLAFAAKLSDVSMGDLQVAFKGLSAWMERNGQVGRDVIEVILEQADAFAQMEDGAGKTNRAVEIFGRGGLQLIPLLNQGSEAIREQIQEARQYGLVVGGEFARNAEIFNDRLTTMASRVQGAAMRITEALIPSLLKLTDTLGAFADKTDWLISVLKLMAVIQAEVFASLVQWGSGLAVSAVSGVVAFTKSIAEGNSVTQAFAQAQAAAAKASSEFKASIEEYARKRKAGTDEDKKAKVVIQEMAGTLDTLRLQFDQLGATRMDLAPRAQIERIREQLQILKEMQQTVGKPETVNGELTEKGLKQAQALLDISKQQADLNREQLAIMDKLHVAGPKEQFLTRMRENFASLGTTMQQLADITSNTIVGAMRGLAGALTDVIMGSKSAGEAFAQFGLSLLTNFIASILEMVLIAKVAIPILTSLGILSGGTTAATGAGVTLAALGAGAAVSSSIVATAATGGLAVGPGNGTSDSIFARISDGEFIMRASATDSIGAENLAEMNRTGELPNTGNGGPGNIHLALLNSEAAVHRYFQNRDGRKLVADLVREQIGYYS